MDRERSQSFARLLGSLVSQSGSKQNELCSFSLETPDKAGKIYGGIELIPSRPYWSCLRLLIFRRLLEESLDLGKSTEVDVSREAYSTVMLTEPETTSYVFLQTVCRSRNCSVCYTKELLG